MARITVDLGGAYEKLSEKARLKGQYALANQALADMNNYVPMLSSDLRNSATIDLDGSGINYNTPYAKAQFYGFVNGGNRVYNYTTAGTSRRWDLRAKASHMSSWTEAYAKGSGL